MCAFVRVLCVWACVHACAHVCVTVFVQNTGKGAERGGRRQAEADPGSLLRRPEHPAREVCSGYFTVFHTVFDLNRQYVELHISRPY